jgi:hypothetical protein
VLICLIGNEEEDLVLVYDLETFVKTVKTLPLACWLQLASLQVW